MISEGDQLKPVTSREHPSDPVTECLITDSELSVVHALNQNMKLHIVHLIQGIGSALNQQGNIISKNIDTDPLSHSMITHDCCCLFRH